MNMQKEAGKVKKLLTQLGMSPISSDFGLIFPQNYLPVMLDGKLLGYIDPKIANHFVNQLRAIKVKDNSGNELYQCIPKSLEIAFMPSMYTVTDNESQATQSSSGDEEVAKEKFFPGIFLASSPSRFVRPVKNLMHGGVEFIGPLEQVNLSIAC